MPWAQLGIGTLTRPLLTGRRLDASAERAPVALAVNRALVP